MAGKTRKKRRATGTKVPPTKSAQRQTTTASTWGGRHLGSTVALAFGCLYFISAWAEPSAGIIAGPVMILGALAYRSAKKRKLGEVKSTPIRQVVEIALLLLISVMILAQNNVLHLIETDPVPNLLIPVGAILAYLVITLMPESSVRGQAT